MNLFFRRLRAVARLYLLIMTETFRMMYGVWKLVRLPRPRVTIFGGSKIDQHHPYAQQAMVLAQKLVDHNISVLTGGGPGIMMAANCGAVSDRPNGLRSMGVNVKGLEEEIINKCVQELVYTNYFYSRKWLLTRYSEAFVVFPGGFGTLDELSEIATLIQTKHMDDSPIVLIGVEFWKPLMTWINDSALKEGLLKEKDRNIIKVTNDLDEALNIVKARCDMAMRNGNSKD